MSSWRDAGSSVCLAATGDFPFVELSASYGVIVGAPILPETPAPPKAVTSGADGAGAAARALPQMPQKDSPWSRKSLPQTAHVSRTPASPFDLTAGANPKSAGSTADDSAPSRWS